MLAQDMAVLRRTSCAGGGERKHIVGGRILGAKPPRARRWVEAIAGNHPRPADGKEPLTVMSNGGCCQVKRKSANTPEIKHWAGIKVPSRGHRHCGSDGYCREAS